MTARKPTRAKHLGVSDDEYVRLLEAQGGHCALCPNRPKTRRLHVDHDHATGRVRGLLCHSCNRRLWTGATAAWLHRAAEYVGQDVGQGACCCTTFSDLPAGTIIADLTCPIHGVNGTNPGDVLPEAYS